MTKSELALLVSRGEGLYLEFKKKVDHPEKIVKEIVAFVNTSGGKLLIGIDDDGTISGLKDADEEAFQLEKAIANLCKPAIKFSLEKVELNKKKQVLVYTFKESRRKPHYVIEDLKTGLGKAYVRINDKSVQASKELKLILKGQRFKKNSGFQYGENERALLKLFESKERISIPEFIEKTSIPYKIVSTTLITLVLNNVLKVIPEERRDLYAIKEV